MSIYPPNIFDFSEYVLHNFIVEVAKFPPSFCAKEPVHEPCITYGAESFYINQNSQFYHPQPNIYQVIDITKEFQTETFLKN
jgi:hypothetical protein